MYLRLSSWTKYSVILCRSLTGMTKRSMVAVHQHIIPGAKVYEHRVVTFKDVENFAKLTGDYNTVHFQDSIVHGVLVNGYVSAVLGTKLPGPGYVVLEQTMFFPNPCYVGEEIEICVEVSKARKIIECSYVCSVLKRACVIHKGIAKLMKYKS